MRITIETDAQEASMSTGQTLQPGGASQPQLTTGTPGAPPDVLAKAAAEGALDAGPAPSEPQQGPGSTPQGTMAQTGSGTGAAMGTPTALGMGASDSAAGAAPGGPDVAMLIEQEEQVAQEAEEGEEGA